ncbi:unnamed protein product [Symbiodinium sp. KB8]|nr:unnamed protein product [Symbiodinium sp. KB8]
MQRGFLNSSDGIFGAAGRKRKSPPAASSGSSSSGPGPVSGADKKDAAADGQGGASSSGADGQGGASSSGADGGFGPYSKEQVQHFVLQLKHMDMLGIDTYVTDNGSSFCIFDLMPFDRGLLHLTSTSVESCSFLARYRPEGYETSEEGFGMTPLQRTLASGVDESTILQPIRDDMLQAPFIPRVAIAVQHGCGGPHDEDPGPGSDEAGSDPESDSESEAGSDSDKDEGCSLCN